MDSAPSSAATTRSDGCFILFSDVNEECRLSGSLPSSTGDWIESGHLCGDAGGVLAEVLLLHLAIVAHDEGHHAAITIHVRIRNHREAREPAPVDEYRDKFVPREKRRAFKRWTGRSPRPGH
jgi:hypothetical protein